MKYLIKNCKIVHKGSKLNGKKVDILISKGVIEEIGKNLSDDKATVIKGKSLHASIGWMDIGTHLGEPGYEHRETFESLAEAALSGGYTDLVTMPKSLPSIQSKAQIKNLILAGQSIGVDIHPIGALSKDLKGENITEIVDMHHAGAVAFSDGLKPVDKSGLLLRALQYVKSFSGLIIHHPNDHTLSNEDQIHEGETSTQLGLKGSPSLAEELITYRDVQLNEYADSKLCMHLISTKESVSIIKTTKKNTSNLTAGVSYLNLIKTDKDLETFDSNLKVSPILRDLSDQKALKKGLSDDTIDYISSNHVPLEIEKKHLEYPYASHGAIGLETCYPALNGESSNLSTELIVQKLSQGPRQVIGLDIPTIEKGQVAKITVFDPTAEWTYTPDAIKSKSKNSPFTNTKMTGKIIATFNGKKSFIN